MNEPLDVALVTCRHKPEPDPDELPLLAALGARGLRAEAWAWDDDSLDWSRVCTAVLRSTWNYPQSPERFLAWVDRTAGETTLHNGAAVVRANLHKGYLLDLERAGVAVAPTELVRRGDRQTVGALARRRGWSRVVVKPAISGSSFMTGRFDLVAAGGDESEAAEGLLAAITADRDALIQLYLPSVEAEGERALVAIDGELTHSIRKSPRFAGDDESVSGERALSVEERELAEAALATVKEPLLYARVDVARGEDGDLRVMELELIEPSLFLIQWPPAMERLVAAIAEAVSGALE